MEVIEPGINRENFEAIVRCTECTAKLKIDVDDVYRNDYGSDTFYVRCRFCSKTFTLDYGVIPEIIVHFTNIGNPPYYNNDDDFYYR